MSELKIGSIVYYSFDFPHESKTCVFTSIGQVGYVGSNHVEINVADETDFQMVQVGKVHRFLQTKHLESNLETIKTLVLPLRYIKRIVKPDETYLNDDLKGWTLSIGSIGDILKINGFATNLSQVGTIVGFDFRNPDYHGFPDVLMRYVYCPKGWNEIGDIYSKKLNIAIPAETTLVSRYPNACLVARSNVIVEPRASLDIDIDEARRRISLSIFEQLCDICTVNFQTIRNVNRSNVGEYAFTHDNFYIDQRYFKGTIVFLEDQKRFSVIDVPLDEDEIEDGVNEYYISPSYKRGRLIITGPPVKQYGTGRDVHPWYNMSIPMENFITLIRMGRNAPIFATKEYHEILDMMSDKTYPEKDLRSLAEFYLNPFGSGSEKWRSLYLWWL